MLLLLDSAVDSDLLRLYPVGLMPGVTLMDLFVS